MYKQINNTINSKEVLSREEYNKLLNEYIEYQKNMLLHLNTPSTLSIPSTLSNR